jgi:hypothetical protein
MFENAVSSNDPDAAGIWTLDESGRLLAETIHYGQSGTVDWCKDSNAASITDEIDSIGLWVNTGLHGSYLDSVDTFEVIDGTVTPDDGDYCLRWYQASNYLYTMIIKSPPITSSKLKLNVSFRAVASYDVHVKISSTDSEEFIDIIIERGTAWQSFQFDLMINGSLLFTISNPSEIYQQVVGIDAFKITSQVTNDTFPLDVELNTDLGYTPTYSLVKGWDQCIHFNGHAYYLNPFLDKRYDNYLLVSIIHSNGSYMYDIASFSNYRELERSDSNIAIAMALLPTFEILILKDKSITSIDPDTGQAREPIYGVSIKSRNSLSIIKGTLFWNDEEDIYKLNINEGFRAIPLLLNNIRDQYLPLIDKQKIIGVRDLLDTYRIRIWDSVNKTEWIFTANGPTEEKKNLFPEIYRIDAFNDLNFLNDGNIYGIQPHIEGALIDDAGNYLIDDAGQTPIAG